MPRVVLTSTAQRDLDALPLPIRARMPRIFANLAHWPHVSGCVRLHGEHATWCRVRTGDYRVLFRPGVETLTVERIRHRRDAY